MLTRSPRTVTADALDRRLCLVAGATALVEDSALSKDHAIADGHSDRFQVALPYLGAFTWTVGRSTLLIDPNRMLFVTAGEDFSETHPISGLGHASIIVTPAPDVLAELCGGDPRRHAAFRNISWACRARAQLLAHALRALGPADPLRSDELTVAFLREALADGAPRWPGAAAPRLVDRARQLLNARYGEPLRLDGIARELGVTGVYLTQCFTRAEGMPLYRYLIKLRLSRALAELPHRDAITGLALDLGFSSHSHFTAAFRSAFGLTPSEFRQLSRSRQAKLRRLPC